VTEIPEHLLKRSRDRRAALGLGGDDEDSGSADAGDSTPAATPAKAAAPAAPAATGPVERAAAPEPAAPEPPKPDTPVVAAYKSRRKVPVWAMAALGILPVWAFMYARAVTETPEEVAGPLGVGEEVYGNCSSCHGAGGGGGTGYGFTDGAVLETFPHIEDQLRYVYYGTGEYNLAGVSSYGNPDREGGARVTGELGVMPGWGESIGGSLHDEEILAVVCHERFTLGGGDPAGDQAEEYEEWCSEESPIFQDLEAGGTFADLDQRFEGIIPIGDAPAAGSPASE
jgi:mono/diheme cytochrome c family protein